MKNLIVKTLKEENILWRKNDYSIIIIWRTKYIFIEFSENKKLKKRYIDSLEIR